MIKEKRCIGEKMEAIERLFIIALPKNKDEVIKVSEFPVAITCGTFYYDDKTSETFSYMDLYNKYTSPKWAKKYIYGYTDDMTITTVNAFCNFDVPWVSTESIEKSNNKLHDKLARLTVWEFYNSKW